MGSKLIPIKILKQELSPLTIVNELVRNFLARLFFSKSGISNSNLETSIKYQKRFLTKLIIFGSLLFIFEIKFVLKIVYYQLINSEAQAYFVIFACPVNVSHDFFESVVS
jgi:hypothetical protein